MKTEQQIKDRIAYYQAYFDQYIRENNDSPAAFAVYKMQELEWVLHDDKKENT